MVKTVANNDERRRKHVENKDANNNEQRKRRVIKKIVQENNTISGNACIWSVPPTIYEENNIKCSLVEFNEYTRNEYSFSIDAMFATKRNLNDRQSELQYECGAS